VSLVDLEAWVALLVVGLISVGLGFYTFGLFQSGDLIGGILLSVPVLFSAIYFLVYLHTFVTGQID